MKKRERIIIIDRSSYEPVEPQRPPIAGDLVHHHIGKTRKIYTWTDSVVVEEPTPLPIISVGNVVVTGASYNEEDNIYKITKDAEFILTADVELPDDDNLTLIIERVLGGDAEKVVGDVRVHTTITAGKMTATGSFDVKGNYMLTQERTNLGFSNLGKRVAFAFSKVEFNVT